MTEHEGITYRDAGVDIGAQDDALALAKDAIRRSFTPGVLGDVGLFGGLFDPSRVGCGDHVLVASADGVGTKLEVARRAGVHDTVGRDLVQHCINDVLVQGARPLFFLDYAAMGRLEPEVIGALIRGCAEACADHGLALLGGETAEMPGLYRDGDFELVGFLVGAVRRDRILDGSAIRPGQALLGLGSDGLHTNGYSLARRVLFDVLGDDLDDRPDELGGRSVGEALLAPHRTYLAPLWPLLEEGLVRGLAHITGGGLPGNVPRILPKDCDAVVRRGSWEVPGIFERIVRGGGVDLDEAHRALNMGVGMVVVVDADDADRVASRLAEAGESVSAIGTVEAGSGELPVELIGLLLAALLAGLAQDAPGTLGDLGDDLESRWEALAAAEPSPARAAEAVALLAATPELSGERLRLAWEVGVAEATALRLESALPVQEALHERFPAAWSAIDLELTLRRLGRYGQGDAVLEAQIEREGAASGPSAAVVGDLLAQRGTAALGSGDAEGARNYLGAGCARGSVNGCVVLARLDLAEGRLEAARAGFRALLPTVPSSPERPKNPLSPWAPRGWGIALLPSDPSGPSGPPRTTGAPRTPGASGG